MFFCAADTHPLQVIGRSRALLSIAGLLWLKKKREACNRNARISTAARPSPSQRHLLARTFGCARFVYNWALALRRDAYRERGEYLFSSDTSAALTTLKQQAETAFRE